MKKYLLACAVLVVGMVMFSSCSDDDDMKEPVIAFNVSEESLTVEEGTEVTIAPTYTYVDTNTTYEWTVNGVVASTTPTLVYTPATAGEYVIVLKVTNAAGTTTKQLTLVVSENVRTLDFEAESWAALIDAPQYGGTLLYGDGGTTPVNYSWSDVESLLSSSLTAAWGGYYGYSEGGVAISNYIDADIQNHATYQYQLAVPASNGSENFAVVYAPASISFSDGEARVIKSMDVSPTTYQLGVTTYGDGYAASLAESGYLAVTIVGKNGDTETGTLTFDLARNGSILTGWDKIDLSSLGEVTSLTFDVDGSDRSDYGVKHPKYFAFDNVVVKF
ncbi:MAG: DUF4465 domain-containing protein [Bacteroidaceae bacterium]|nr:DUF4465 domain-containing protein [Bacteroidaceae bacterium]